MLERLFHLSENQTTIRRELLGGLTTFLAMSYIIFLQPGMQQDAGMDFDAVMVATCLASAIGTFLMAFLANYPIAMAPGVGLNVFFTYAICIGMGVPWQTALGAIFIAGLLFVLLGAFGFRKYVMDIIPASLKFGIAVGIGLMICLVGLEWAGIVVDDKVTLVKVGNLTKPAVIVSGIGLIISMLLICYSLRGAILGGIAVAGFTAWYMGLVTYQGVFSTPPSLAPTFLAMQPWEILSWQFLSIIFVFIMIDLFDTVGTLVGVAELGGFTKGGGELPRARQALLSDALGTMAGAALGTSTVTSYVESCSGISDGARTGLANVMTGLLFILALFFSPLVKMVGSYNPIIAPALIMVGFMMMRGVKHINWEEPTDGIPAFLTIVFIAFSLKITEGIGFGIMSFVLLKLATGKIREVNPALFILSVLFGIQFFYLSF